MHHDPARGGPQAGRLARAHRVLLLTTVAGACVVILPGFADPVILPKLTWLFAGCIGLVVVSLVRMLRSGRLVLPSSRWLIPLVLVLLTMALATATSDQPGTSLLGRYTRYQGLAPYAAYALVLVSVAVLYRHRRLASLTWTLLGTLAAVLTYGAVQVAGADPIGWNAGLDEPLFSFLGNTNFASAVAGMLVPLALSVALRRETQIPLRLLAAVLGAVAVVYTVLLQALQGPVIAVVGAGLVLLVRAGDPRAIWRMVPRGRRPVVAAAGLLGVLIVAVPAVQFVVDDLPKSLHQRTQLWAAAGSMFAEQPVTGVGLDGYGEHFLQHRPVAHAEERGLASADAAHQVPLSMFAHGGVPLGVAWMAFVGSIGFLLVRGLRRSDGDRRLELAGWGGMWLGYQVQALVSVDVPPVALLHFTAAGAVLALTGQGVLRPVGHPVVQRVPRLVAGVLVLALVVPVLGQTLRPLRADANHAYALDQSRADQPEQALAASAEAVRLNPWEPSYRRAYGKRLAAVDPQAGLDEQRRAALILSGSVSYALDVVRQAARNGDRELSLQWQLEAARRDWQSPGALQRDAGLLLDGGRPDLAVPVLRRLTELRPERPAVWQRLGAALDAAGDAPGARAAYEQVLVLRPGADAQAELSGAGGQ